MLQGLDESKTLHSQYRVEGPALTPLQGRPPAWLVDKGPAQGRLPSRSLGQLLVAGEGLREAIRTSTPAAVPARTEEVRGLVHLLNRSLLGPQLTLLFAQSMHLLTIRGHFLSCEFRSGGLTFPQEIPIVSLVTLLRSHQALWFQ